MPHRRHAQPLTGDAEAGAVRRLLAFAEPPGGLEDLSDRQIGQQPHGQHHPQDDLVRQPTAARIDPASGRERLLNVLGADHLFESRQSIQNPARVVGRQRAMSLWHASQSLLGALLVGKPKVTGGCDLRLFQRYWGKALEFLHSRGIIHRDLKPENILTPTEAECKVGDFGLAVMQDKAGLLTRSIRGLGTPGYVSPEQQYGLKIDERTDQYSLAALTYELLTGRRPLGQFLPPSRHNVQLPRKLDLAILRGLAEEPRDRYPSVGAFLTAFEQSLTSSPRTGLGRRPAVTRLLIILLGVAGAAAFATFGPGKDAPGLGRDRQDPNPGPRQGLIRARLRPSRKRLAPSLVPLHDRQNSLS